MAGAIATALKQQSKFNSREQEVLLGLRIATARILDPWEKFLKTTADLTPNQYNVLRILRGSHPSRLACGEIADRMISRDPDITRLIDRLSARELVDRVRSERDRRVVEVGITGKGRATLRDLDVHAEYMPKAMLGRLGPKKLAQLAQLLGHVLQDMGTFPDEPRSGATRTRP
jgi:DNA-binding MarR family transcriptional regulator